MNETVLISGASGKIGSVLAANFLDQNYQVIGLCSQLESKEKLEKQFPQFVSSGKLKVIAIDFFTKNWIESLGDINPHYIVWGARAIKHLKADESKLGKVDREDFSGEFHLGVIAPYELVMVLVNRADTKLKSMVLLGSIYGEVASNLNLYDNPIKESFIHYGIVKSAQIHLAKELSVRLVTKNVRVNIVSYGGVAGRTTEAFKQRYAKFVPQGRMLNEDELFVPVEFLLSDKAKSIIGHNLNVDGGWTLW